MKNTKKVLFCLIIVILALFTNVESHNKTEKIKVNYYEKIDGDTAKFELNGKVFKVRFLGINTPETVDKTADEEPYGKEASNYTKERLENANKIEIEYDQNAQKEDKYERILAWVWVDESLLQKELLEQGLANTYMLQDNYKYAGVLQLAKEKAKNSNVGIWSKGITCNNLAEENEIQKEEKEDNNGSNLVIIVIIIVFIIVISIEKRKKK